LTLGRPSPYGPRVLRLLRLISYPQLRASWGRTLLVVGGIATGVALMVAINVINVSILDNLRRTIDRVAGKAELEITLGVGELGMDDSVLAVAQTSPAVQAALPLVRGSVALADDPSTTLLLFGADLSAEDQLNRYQIEVQGPRADVVRAIDDPRSVLVARALAEQRRLALGDTVELATPDGVAPYTIRGLLETTGLASVFGGQLVVMDLTAAQKILHKEGRIDQIDLLLQDGANVDEVQRALQERLPPGVVVARPQQRGAIYENAFRSFQAMLTGLSLLCLVAAVYLIYNTTSTGAVRRAFTMASLQVFGAEPARLFRLLMLEALVLGSLGVLVGIPSGIALARLLTGLVSSSMGVIFQLRFPVEHLTLAPSHQAIIAGIGIGAALFASWFAAERVRRLDALEVMRSRVHPAMGHHLPSRGLVGWWLAMVAVSALALVAEVHWQSIAFGNLGSTLWNASAFVIAIPLVNWSANGLSRLLPRLFRSEGQIAAEGLFRSRVRTGVTVAAVALVLTLAITVASLAESFRSSVASYFQADGVLGGDLVVSAIATEGGWLESPIAMQVADEIARLPEFDEVETVRLLFGQPFHGDRIAIAGLSEGLLDARGYDARYYWRGDPEEGARELRSGRGATIGAALAERYDLDVGDTIQLDTVTGPLALRVVGIVRDYIADRGTVTLNRRLIAEHWQDTTINRIHVSLKPGVTPAEGRRSIAAALGDRHRLKILSLAEVVDYQVSAIDRAFAFTDAIQLLITIVALAGILDLLLATIVERRREFALWRVMGADERSVRRSIVIEATTIGALGTILGTSVGLVTAWIWVGINFRYLLGYYLDYHLAWAAMTWYAVVVLGMSALAAAIAGRYAVQQPVLEGIQIE
jgi:putative ABC transport system permease protein